MRLRKILVFLVLLTAACGEGGTTASGPEVLGEQLFNSIVVGGKAGCASCHSVDLGEDGVGPSLASIPTVAEGRVPGLTASEYLRFSITDPDNYLVEGFESGVMPKGWDLTNTQIDSLVDYLLSLK